MLVAREHYGDLHPVHRSSEVAETTRWPLLLRAEQPWPWKGSDPWAEQGKATGHRLLWV